PDFRSKGGLFKKLRSQHNIKASGKHLFDASVYKDDDSTSSFHEMVRSLSKETKSAKPTEFHHLLATLARDGRLMRLYTQNVDGIDTSLEPLATRVPLVSVKKEDKVTWPTTVQLHGGLDKMVCTKCHKLSDFQAELFDGPVPPFCSDCEQVDTIRTQHEGKRSHGIGRLRPRMVLYNEHNPDDEAIGAVTRADLRSRPDVVVVVGTTLKVPGVRRIVREMCASVRDKRDGMAIWINKEPPPISKEFEDCWDIVVRGTCDEVALCAQMRRWWEPRELPEISPEDCDRASKAKPEVEVTRAKKRTSTDEKEVLRVQQLEGGFTKHPSFKLLNAGMRTPQSSPQRPSFSPFTCRKRSITTRIEDSFTEEGEDVCVPPTPSKSARTSPIQKTLTVAEALKPSTTSKPAAKTKTAKPKAKTKSNVKFVKANPKVQAVKAAKKATSKNKNAPAAKPQISINFKQSKAASTLAKATKGEKPGMSPPAKTSPPSLKIKLQLSGASKREASQPNDIVRPLSPQTTRNKNLESDSDTIVIPSRSRTELNPSNLVTRKSSDIASFLN
ncbi:hypothetical protein LTR66_003168, partial [Elasticomyces elasticus]